jgi:hypothetical protein
MKNSTKILIGLSVVGVAAYFYYRWKTTTTIIGETTDGTTDGTTGSVTTGGVTTGGVTTGGVTTGGTTTGGTTTGGTTTGGTTTGGTIGGGTTGGGTGGIISNIYEHIVPTQPDLPDTNFVRARQECLRSGGQWIITSGGGYCLKTPPPLPKPITLNQGIVPGITNATITPIWTPATNPNLSCFVSGTLITLDDKTQLPIEDIKIGMRVLSFNEKNKNQEISIVTKLIQSQNQETLLIKTKDIEIRCTKEHPFWVNDAWVIAKDLKIGDNLTAIDGVSEIQNITSVLEEKEVYNLTTEENHTYYANNILVHNKQTYTGSQAQTALQQLQQIFSPYNVYNSTSAYTNYNSASSSYSAY